MVTPDDYVVRKRPPLRGPKGVAIRAGVLLWLASLPMSCIYLARLATDAPVTDWSILWWSIFAAPFAAGVAQWLAVGKVG
jgi:hypothetical protein